MHRLLEIAEIVRRLRPLAERPRTRTEQLDAHRRLRTEIDRLFGLLGLDTGTD